MENKEILNETKLKRDSLNLLNQFISDYNISMTQYPAIKQAVKGKNFNWNGLVKNLAKAGVPDEKILQLSNALTAARGFKSGQWASDAGVDKRTSKILNRGNKNNRKWYTGDRNAVSTSSSLEQSQNELEASKQTIEDLKAQIEQLQQSTSQAPQTQATPYGSSKVRANVKHLQELLNASGYDCGTPDGKFGPTTLEKLDAFFSRMKKGGEIELAQNTDATRAQAAEMGHVQPLNTMPQSTTVTPTTAFPNPIEATAQDRNSSPSLSPEALKLQKKAAKKLARQGLQESINSMKSLMERMNRTDLGKGSILL